MPIYELAMQITANTEQEAVAIAIERLQGDRDFDLDKVGE